MPRSTRNFDDRSVLCHPFLLFLSTTLPSIVCLSTTCFTTGATKRYDTLSADYCYYALHDKPRYDLHLIMRSLFPVQPTPLGPTYYAMLSLRC